MVASGSQNPSRKDDDMSTWRFSRLMRLPSFRYDTLRQITPGREASRPSDLQHRQAGSAAMQVNGPGPVSGNMPIGRLEPAGGARQPEAARPASPRDEVEISEASRMFDQLSQSSAVRAERLAQIKAEIDAGTYETPEKLEAALLKLFGEAGLGDGGDE
jgi:negative regulator of flagellin synthesis FlgM